MSTKKTFTREDIIETAFQLTRKHGKKKLSAREIAKTLNSSTMPIYSTISSMKELEREVGQKFTELFLKYSLTPQTGDVLIDSSFGYIQFAKHEKHLFRIMFFGDEESEISTYKEQKQIILNTLSEYLKQQPDLDGLNDRQLQRILEKMETFIHGLACLVNFGRCEDDSDEHIINLLREVSTLFIQQEKASE